MRKISTGVCQIPCTQACAHIGNPKITRWKIACIRAFMHTGNPIPTRYQIPCPHMCALLKCSDNLCASAIIYTLKGFEVSFKIFMFAYYD